MNMIWAPGIVLPWVLSGKKETLPEKFKFRHVKFWYLKGIYTVINPAQGYEVDMIRGFEETVERLEGHACLVCHPPGGNAIPHSFLSVAICPFFPGNLWVLALAWAHIACIMLRSSRYLNQALRSYPTGGWSYLTVAADINDCGNLVSGPFLISIGGNVTNDGAERILLKLSQTLSWGRIYHGLQNSRQSRYAPVTGNFL